MAYIPLPKNAAKDAVLVEQKSGTTVKIDDSTPVSVDVDDSTPIEVNVQQPVIVNDWFIETAKGNIAGHSFVHKFGRNESVGTSLVPVAEGGIYPTPQTSSTVTLEVISTSANDTAAGTGAREITLEYLDNTGAVQTGTIATNGTSASTETISGVWRLPRFYVSASGSYAGVSTPSQEGTITIRVSGGGATWGVLGLVDTAFGAGQSLVACYTVPLGKTAYILQTQASVDTGKSVDIMFFARRNSDETTAPYSALRVQNYYEGITDQITFTHKTHEAYPALTDIGFMAKTSTGTAGVSCEFELLLVDDA